MPPALASGALGGAAPHVVTGEKARRSGLQPPLCFLNTPQRLPDVGLMPGGYTAVQRGSLVPGNVLLGAPCHLGSAQSPGLAEHLVAPRMVIRG